MRVSVLVGCALLVAACPAFSATIHVSPDGSGDYPTIQAAIEGASSGDEILLSDGVFTGDGNWDLNFGTKELVLRSEHGYAATTIDCGSNDENWSSHEGILIEGGQTSATKVEGLTIQHVFWPAEGGAILCVGASPVIESVRIRWNHAHGGILVQGGAPLIEDCYVLESTNLSPAAIFGENSSPTLRRCSFTRLSAPSVVSLDGGVVVGCTIEDTSGPYSDHESQGECVWFRGGQGSILTSTFRRNFGFTVMSMGDVVLDGCRFEENVGDHPGFEAYRGSATIRNSVFLGNLSGGPGSHASAVYFAGGTLSLDHCVFASNNTDAVGVAGTAALSVKHCTFVGNGSRTHNPDGPGSSIASLSGAPSITIDHNIITQGGPRTVAVYCHVAPTSLVATCSDIYGNPGGDWTGCLAGMDTAGQNISKDPLLCDVANGDLRLQSASPCAPPNDNGCGLFGALGVGCGTTALQERSWGSIKALYR
ncbi:MAG: right-handed parallel beta-helix repeat-containing protein [bacterium]